MRRLILVLAVTSLGACSVERDADGNATARGEAPGTVFAASADRATGSLEVALPGAKFDVDVPAGMLAESEFDIDGLKLYPGSTVEGMDIKSVEAAGDDKRSTVRISYTAPAAPAVVRAWYLSQSASLERPLQAAGDALAGSTEEGKAITMRFEPVDQRTRGLILVEG